VGGFDVGSARSWLEEAYRLDPRKTKPIRLGAKPGQRSYHRPTFDQIDRTKSKGARMSSFFVLPFVLQKSLLPYGRGIHIFQPGSRMFALSIVA
jgi:hypothetical protein